jgi:hypothetical protein
MNIEDTPLHRNAELALNILRTQFPHGARRENWLQQWQQAKGGATARGASDDVFDRAKDKLLKSGDAASDGKGKGAIYWASIVENIRENTTLNRPQGSYSASPQPLRDAEHSNTGCDFSDAIIQQQIGRIRELEAEVARLNAIIEGNCDALGYLQKLYTDTSLPLSVGLRAATAALNFERARPPSLSLNAHAGLAEALALARAQFYEQPASSLPLQSESDDTPDSMKHAAT